MSGDAARWRRRAAPGGRASALRGCGAALRCASASWRLAASALELTLLSRAGEAARRPMRATRVRRARGRDRGGAAGTDYVYIIPGRGDRARPAVAPPARGPHGPSRIVDPRAFAWTRRRLARAAARATTSSTSCTSGRSRPRGRSTPRPRGCRTCAALGRHRGRADAGRRVPGRAQLGLRRRLPLRAAVDATAGPTGSSAWSTPAHAPRPRGRSSTSSTTTSAPRGTTSPSSARTSPTATARPGATRSTSTAPTATRCARFFIDNALYWLTEYHVDAPAPGRDPRHLRLRRRATSSQEIEARRRRRGGAAGRPAA